MLKENPEQGKIQMGEEAGAPVSGWLCVTGACVQCACVCEGE